MKSLIIFVVFLILAFAPFQAHGNEDYGFGIGLSVGYEGFGIKKEGIPDAVMEEAKNPTLYNHYSGNSFGVDKIGKYDPADTLNYYFLGLSFDYIPQIDSPIVPYLKVTVKFPMDGSTHEGSYNEGYTYFQMIEYGGRDYVGYTAGWKFEDDLLFAPEIGVIFKSKGKYSLSLGVARQEVDLGFYKGMEAYGKTESLQKVADVTYTYNIYNARFLVPWNDDISTGYAAIELNLSGGEDVKSKLGVGLLAVGIFF